MSNKSKLSLVTTTLPLGLRNNLLMILAKIGSVHISIPEDQLEADEIELTEISTEKIELLENNVQELFRNLSIQNKDIKGLENNGKIEYKSKDIDDLYHQISDDIDLYLNRIYEIQRYLAKASVELEHVLKLKMCYSFLEQLKLNRYNMTFFKELDLKLYTTFSKNVSNLHSLFESSVFPCIYEIQEIMDDKVVFYIIYPKKKEEDLKDRITLIHAEEIPIYRKYLTYEGVNFKRIDKEINFINKTIEKYQKEIARIRDEKIRLFAAIDEITSNMRIYKQIEHSFTNISSSRESLKFFIPKMDLNILKGELSKNFKEKVTIDRKSVV